MKKKYVMFILLSSMQFLPLKGYIYHAIVMRKWQEELNRYHYFIGLGDFHQKQHAANQEHVQAFQELLTGTERDSVKILTEDLSVANDQGRRSVKGFSVNSRGGLLGGLTEMCRHAGIVTENLEYRYARVCALGPVLNNPGSSPFSFDSTKSLLVKDLAAEIYSELDRITGYDDFSEVRPWYQQCALKVKNGMRALKWTERSGETVAEYLARTGKAGGNFLQHLLTFDACLLDAKIVHEVLHHPQVERICAVAGGSHIDRASNVLKTMGYVPVLHMQSGRAVGSAIDVSGFAHNLEQIKPAPISLHMLKSYF